MLNSARLFVATTLCLLVGSATARSEEQVSRVVSMNLCTDQLAMLIAATGQLHSVSWLAGDKDASALAGDTDGLVFNHGLAEEIFLMEPDLVLSGTYTTRATVELLRRLGIRVEQFAPENSLEDIRKNIVRMGDVLNRKDRADEIVAAFDSAVAASSTQSSSHRTAATYFANSYTAGSGTLVDAIITASGLENIASRMGYSGTARLPLEVLLMAAPDVLVDADERPPMPALAQENFVHPAYRQLSAQSSRAIVPARFTICGGPFTAGAIRILRHVSVQTDKTQ